MLICLCELKQMRSPTGVTNGAGVQPEGTGTGCKGARAGGKQQELQSGSDTSPHSTAEKYTTLERGGQEPGSVF